MNAREVRCGVSGYEGREKREKRSVKWDTRSLVRRNLGAGNVMEVSRMIGSDFRCKCCATSLYLPNPVVRWRSNFLLTYWHTAA